MDASGIISYARRLCGGVSVGQVSDSIMLDLLDKSYKDFYKKIVNLDKNYFRDRWTATTVAEQYEYEMMKPNGTEYGIFKPENVRIKYTSTSDFVDVFLTDRDAMKETPERYAVNQSVDEPFAVITDNKYLHIFPTPTEAVTGGLLLEGAKQPYKLTTSSTESEILIDPLYHETIAYMMCPSIYKEMVLIDKKNDAIQEAELEINKALKSMGLLKTKVIRCNRPDLTSLE